MHRADERSGSEVVHHVCSAGGRRGNPNGRRSGEKRRASSHPKSLWRLLRIAMRVLYAGAYALSFTVAVPEQKTERKRSAQGDRRKHLPLYRISEYFEGNSFGRAEHERGLKHGNQICRRL